MFSLEILFGDKTNSMRNICTSLTSSVTSNTAVSDCTGVHVRQCSPRINSVETRQDSGALLPPSSLDRQKIGGDKREDEKFPLGSLPNSNHTICILGKWEQGMEGREVELASRS